jgi:cation transport regulator ChaC
MKNRMISIMLLAFLRASSIVSKSWTISWCLYRLHGIRLMGPPEEEIWYFAYGANMHDSAFRKMRGMNPSEWRPGLIRGYRLRFNLIAGKTAYANICPDQSAEVWGVLYQITRRDLVRLEATEGVPWGGYRPHWVNMEDTSGAVVEAATLMARGHDVDRMPSHRYITLLREGARAHGLPDHYIQFLEQIEHKATQ